jgi:hypothetical protein
VFGVRLVVVVEYGVDEVPAPMFTLPESGIRVPKVSLQLPGVEVAMRNHALVLVPFGFAVPFNIAEDVVIEEAALVVALGS